MVALVNIAQAVGGDLGIYLRCGYIRMAQHLLHGPQIGAVLQQVGGKGMPQGMRGNLPVDAGLAHVLFQDFPEPLPGQTPAVDIYKNGGFLAVANQLTRPRRR